MAAIRTWLGVGLVKVLIETFAFLVRRYAASTLARAFGMALAYVSILLVLSQYVSRLNMSVIRMEASIPLHQSTIYARIGMTGRIHP